MAEWNNLEDLAQELFLTIEKNSLIDKYYFRGPYKTLSGAKKHMVESELESVMVVKYGLFRAYISFDHEFLTEEKRGAQNRFKEFIEKSSSSYLYRKLMVEDYRNQGPG